jgi:excisionase family DNA binding protein
MKQLNSNDFSNGYYTIAECAKRLATSPQTIYNWIGKGEFAPVIKVASTLRVRVEDFDYWLQSNVITVVNERGEK